MECVFLFLSFLCGILFFCFKDQSFSNALFSQFPYFEETIIWNEILTFLNNAPYVFFIPMVILAFWGLKNNNVLFSLWDSQGKITPSDTDCFEIFKEITHHIRPKFPFLKRKQLVVIEDLDRSENPNIVERLLKELYRFVTLMDQKEKKQFIFVVSLKSEASLKNKDEKEGLSLYSKIFDYTVWIRPIHYNNVQEIIKPLLIEKLGKKKTALLINDLEWIMKGSMLTVREIKDRLNETFLLHQSLVNRKDTNSLVSYKKCAAVVYLQRQYPKIYQILIENEDGFKQLITETYYLEKEITKELIESSIFSKEKNNASIKETKDDFINDLLEMIKAKDIENDYLMYFYNYPKNSYIMNSAEKQIFDYLIHNNYNFKDDDTVFALLTKIIINNKGLIIEKAIKELKDNKKCLGRFVYHFENIFLFIYENEKKELVNSYKSLFMTQLNVADSFVLFEDLLNLNISDEITKEFINISIPVIISKNKEHPFGINNLRHTLFTNHPGKIHLLYELCINKNEDLPVITTKVIDSINSVTDLFNCLDFSKIKKESVEGNLKSLEKFDFSDDENSIKLVKKLKEISNLKEVTESHSILFSILKKNKIFDTDLFSILYNSFVLKNKKEFLEYIQTINYSKLSDDDLQKIDDLHTDEITDINLIELLEKNNKYNSTIYSRIKLNNFDSFDFSAEWIKEKIKDICLPINEEIPDYIIILRLKFIKSGNVENAFSLFNEPFDFVKSEEIVLLNETDIYWAIDFTRVENEDPLILSNYCNNKNLKEDNLFNFFDTILSDEENKISDMEYLNNLLSLIDFIKCPFDSMKEEQQNKIITLLFDNLELNDYGNSLQLLKKIKCHNDRLDTIIQDNIIDDELDEYLEVCNDISKPSNLVIEYIGNQAINYRLSKSITDRLKNEGYYLNYIIGKTLFNNQYFYEKDINLTEYYKAYCTSNNYFELTKNTSLIDLFYNEELYTSELSLEKLMPFKKFERQSYKLIKLFFEKLQKDEEKKEYIATIGHINTYEDSKAFIDLITSDEYINLCDDQLFVNIVKEKLWEKDPSGKDKKGVLKRNFSILLNKKLSK